MTDNEFDLAARAWLDDGPTRMSDRAVLSALEEIHTTRQRRALRPAWRTTPVSIFARVAVAAVLVIAVGLVAGNLIRRQLDLPSVGVPAALPSPAHSVAMPDLTKTFVSPRNGFSIKYPEGTAFTPATNLLGIGGDDGFDIVETGSGGLFKATSIEAPAAVSIDDWIDSVVDDYARGCNAPRRQQTAITIDGFSGRTGECGGKVDATVLVGSRLYLFTLLHEPTDARAIFDAFTATIDLTPDSAVDYPSPDTTFVSPSSGYSFEYFDRGGLTPAKALWDPLTQPLPDNSGRYDGPFDVVETGHGAVFKGASTPIPDGVSVDAWVDEHLTPGFCGISRSQQAEITIDGHAGKVQECANQIDATVVAGGRLYLFTMMHSRADARAWFDAFVSTIKLTPDDAATPSGSP